MAQPQQHGSLARRITSQVKRRSRRHTHAGYGPNAKAFGEVLRTDHGVNVEVKPGERGDFHVSIDGKVFLDKQKTPGAFIAKANKPYPSEETARALKVAISEYLRV